MVLTFPFAWRRRLAHDGALLCALTRIFVEAVHRFYARHTGEHGERAVKGGSVTVVQRTSSDLRLNPHLHVVLLDGVYREDGAELTWQALRHLQNARSGRGARARGAADGQIRSSPRQARRYRWGSSGRCRRQIRRCSRVGEQVASAHRAQADRRHHSFRCGVRSTGRAAAARR